MSDFIDLSDCEVFSPNNVFSITPGQIIAIPPNHYGDDYVSLGDALAFNEVFKVGDTRSPIGLGFTILSVPGEAVESNQNIRPQGTIILFLAGGAGTKPLASAPNIASPAPYAGDQYDPFVAGSGLASWGSLCGGLGGSSSGRADQGDFWSNLDVAELPTPKPSTDADMIAPAHDYQIMCQITGKSYDSESGDTYINFDCWYVIDGVSSEKNQASVKIDPDTQGEWDTFRIGIGVSDCRSYGANGADAYFQISNVYPIGFDGDSTAFWERFVGCS